MKKLLITGGPVHAKIDAVKFVTNRFKGGLMAELADNLRSEFDITYLCSKGCKMPECRVELHDGFQDYREKVLAMAPEYDAVVLGAAVSNLIPIGLRNKDGSYTQLPLTGKFPSHNYLPGEVIPMDWAVAPRVIDEVKKVMKPSAHLFGFKLLSGVTHEELVSAAYGVLLESKSTLVFANDAKDLQSIFCIGKDRSVRHISRECLGEEISLALHDMYYRTEESPWSDPDEKSVALRLIQEQIDPERVHASPEGLVFGTIAVLNPDGSFYTTARGKKEFDDVVKVQGVDHHEMVVRTEGGKATLNAPLLDRIFMESHHIAVIKHYHDLEGDLPVLEWAPPGTYRDSFFRDICFVGSFNIEGHGCYLLYNKEGKLL